MASTYGSSVDWKLPTAREASANMKCELFREWRIIGDEILRLSSEGYGQYFHICHSGVTKKEMTQLVVTLRARGYKVFAKNYILTIVWQDA